MLKVETLNRNKQTNVANWNRDGDRVKENFQVGTGTCMDAGGAVTATGNHIELTHVLVNNVAINSSSRSLNWPWRELGGSNA